MRHLLTFLALAIFALVLALVAINFLPNEPLAVDEVALSPACSAPKPNPCAKVDCNRRDTKEIA